METSDLNDRPIDCSRKQHVKITSSTTVEELETEIVMAWCCIKSIRVTVMQFCWQLLSLRHMTLTSGRGGLPENAKGNESAVLLLLLLS